MIVVIPPSGTCILTAGVVVVRRVVPAGEVAVPCDAAAAHASYTLGAREGRARRQAHWNIVTRSP